MSGVRKRLAVWKFASCDGCQLSLLSAQDELLVLAERVEIAYFLEATSRIGEGPYDVSLVEGSITTPGDVERIHRVRALSGAVITIGACATAGGIQALRNFGDAEAMRGTVYADPTYVATLATSTAIADHITVDAELRGCPVEPAQLIEMLSAMLAGRKPVLPSHSVCLDCKRRGTVCVTVAGGQPCLGPVTHTGCGARCPAVGRGCYGCFGPSEIADVDPNQLDVLADQLLADGSSPDQLLRLFRTYNAGAPALVQLTRRLESATAAQSNLPEVSP